MKCAKQILLGTASFPFHSEKESRLTGQDKHLRTIQQNAFKNIAKYAKKIVENHILRSVFQIVL